MEKHKISIIIPVFNAEKYLARCLDSVLGQSYKNIEIILVDDESKDGSLKICNCYAERDNRIKVITKKNEGAGIARNLGLQEATGDYIGFVDSDDMILPEMYEKLYNAMIDKEADIAYCKNTNEFFSPNITNQIIYFGNDSVEKLILGEIGTRPDEKLDNYYGTSVWRGLYKKVIINNNCIKFESERKVGSEDLLFNVSYLFNCKSAVYVCDELYIHCLNSESMTNSVGHFNVENEVCLYKKLEDILSNNCIDEFKLELDRFFIKRIRCAIMSLCEKINVQNFSNRKNAIKSILENEFVTGIMRFYPGNKLPIKQRIFYYIMKYKFSTICVFACKLSR